jgi:uncharacterized protein with PIN domain
MVEVRVCPNCHKKLFKTNGSIPHIKNGGKFYRKRYRCTNCGKTGY